MNKSLLLEVWMIRTANKQIESTLVTNVIGMKHHDLVRFARKKERVTIVETVTINPVSKVSLSKPVSKLLVWPIPL